MKRLFAAFTICFALPTAALGSGPTQEGPPPQIYFIAEHLTIPLEVTNTWRTSNPPKVDIHIKLPSGFERTVERISEPQLKALQHALQNERIASVLEHGAAPKPDWFDGVARQMLERSLVQPLNVTTNYGDLSDDQIAQLRNYIAELAIEQIKLRAQWGVPQVAPPNIAARVESGVLDITKPLTIERVLNFGTYSIYMTDQGQLYEDEFAAFQQAHDEWRVRGIFKKQNADQEAAKRAAVLLLRSLPGLQPVNMDCFELQQVTQCHN